MKVEFYKHQRLAVIFCGLFLAALILETGLRLGGFIMLSLQEYKNLQAIKEKGSCRIMCLGESTTLNQYPRFLEEVLNQRNVGVKFSVIDRGLIGIDTGVILSQLEANLDKYKPDIVVTMMGCNDGGIMYYQDIPEADGWLFRHCRAYRFSRLIYTHILKKLKKEDVHREEVPSPNQGRPLDLNSKNNGSDVELGVFYRRQGKFSEADELFRRAIELDPKDARAPIELGVSYRRQMRFAEAEELFRRTIGHDPKNDWAYVELGVSYLNQNKFAEAEEAFKRAIELNPKDDMTYGALEVLNIEKGNSVLAGRYGKKARELRAGYYCPMTNNNYLKLRTILHKRGIVYVCAQYPIRNLGPLKKIFQGKAEGVVFVDNEKIFKAALEKGSYREYFRDSFGYDFGHCTDKGNRLLAENMANTILKEVFKKRPVLSQ